MLELDVERERPGEEVDQGMVGEIDDVRMSVVKLKVSDRTDDVEAVPPISELAEEILGSGLVAIEIRVVFGLVQSVIQQLNLYEYLAHSVIVQGKHTRLSERTGGQQLVGMRTMSADNLYWHSLGRRLARPFQKGLWNNSPEQEDRH